MINKLWPLLIQKTKLKSNQFVNNIYNSISTINTNFETRLHPVIINILRYGERNPRNINLYNLQFIKTHYLNYYISQAIELINLAGSDELKRFARIFKQKLAKNQIIIRDLSKDERLKLQKKLSKKNTSLSQSIVDHNSPVSINYSITGIYGHQHKYFGIDFARGLEDTLISISHEIVHAANPRLDQLRRDYIKYYPQVFKILTKYFSPSQSIFLIDKNFLFNSFSKEEQVHLSNLSRNLRSIRIKQLTQQDNKSPIQINTAEKEIIIKWIDAGIGLTIDNEYHAYGLSMELYASLKNKYHFTLRSSRNYSQILENIILGDANIYNQLAMKGNPFLHIKIPFTSSQTKNKTYIKFLELIYLKRIDHSIKSLHQRYATSLKNIKLDDPRNNPLPIWTRKGYFDHPSNPYIMATAKFSTYWIIQLSKSMRHVLEKLQNINIPLMLLKSNIIDLHNLTVQDLKIIGTHFLDNTSFDIPYFIPNELSLNHYIIASPQFKAAERNYINQYQQFFTFYKKKKNNYSSYIDGTTLKENLIKLHLYKNLLWLKSFFPLWHSSVRTTQAFIKKVQDNNISYSDGLTETRVKELYLELMEILNDAYQSELEINLLKIIGEQLIISYQIVLKYPKWEKLISSFMQEVTSIQDIFIMLNISYPIDYNLSSFVDQSLGKLEKQLATSAEYCHDSSDKDENLISIIDKSKIFSLQLPTTTAQSKEITFPLTILCYQEELYILRQPNDFNQFMTSKSVDNLLFSKIFRNSHFIKLSPYKFKYTKKPFFFFF